MITRHLIRAALFSAALFVQAFASVAAGAATIERVGPRVMGVGRQVRVSCDGRDEEADQVAEEDATVACQNAEPPADLFVRLRHRRQETIPVHPALQHE